VLESPYVFAEFSTLLLQAGEPLTMPIAFYDDATALHSSAFWKGALGRRAISSRCRPTPW